MPWLVEVAGNIGSFNGMKQGIYQIGDNDYRHTPEFWAACNSVVGITITDITAPVEPAAPVIFSENPDPTGHLTLSMLKGENLEVDLRCKVDGCKATEPYRNDHARKAHHSRSHSNNPPYDVLYPKDVQKEEEKEEPSVFDGKDAQLSPAEMEELK